MNYNIEVHEIFSKEFKVLLKKYPSLKSDFQNILNNIEKELILADDLGNGFKKIRINGVPKIMILDRNLKIRYIGPLLRKKSNLYNNFYITVNNIKNEFK